MTPEDDESTLDQILRLLDAQRQLLKGKLEPEDHSKFMERSRQIKDLIARLSHPEPAGRT